MTRAASALAALLALAAFAYEVRAQQTGPATAQPAPRAPAVAPTSAGPSPVPVPADTALLTAEGAARAAYRYVSFAPGTHNDWSRLLGLFLPEAVLVMSNSRTTHGLYTVGAFVDNFVRFDSAAAGTGRGFHETILGLHATVVGDIAHVLVLYESRVLGTTRPLQRGVDSWELVQRDGRWWVVSLTNQSLAADAPVPPELRP